MKTQLYHRTLSLVLLLIVFNFCQASIKLPAIVGDNMVLQRDVKVNIWGWATKGSEILVNFNAKTYKTITDASGKWSTKLDATKAGGPYKMTIKGDGSDLSINNILMGEVWICSGQSNMEYQLRAERFKTKYDSEIANSTNDIIRQFSVEKAVSADPLNDCISSGWKAANPTSILDFSAIGYFFGLELYKQLNVPIGLIRSSWGGTKAEAWTSIEGLKEFPQFNTDINVLKDPVKLEQKRVDFRKNWKNWDNRLQKEDKGYVSGKAEWAGNIDESGWTIIADPDFVSKFGFTDKTGSFWFRKTIVLTEDMTKSDAIIILGRMDDADSTYFNGQWIGATNGYNNRNYTVPAKFLKVGENTIAVRIVNFGGRGGIFPEDKRNFKSGDKELIISGDWKFKPGAVIPPKPGEYNVQNLATSLYNGMVSPLLPFTIKGVVWYQGESNSDRSEEYKTLFPAMISDWRTKFNQGNFPFIFMQLAAFESNAKQDWAELREAQSMTLSKVPNTGMAVGIDIGEQKDIHPIYKKEAGSRLALSAMKVAYKDDKQVTSGPIYKSMTVLGDKVIITFDNIGSGLEAKNGVLKQFTIADESKNFVAAQAEIVGNTVVVTAKEVSKPIAVRYAYSSYPEGCNLYNKEGLPASPFRTDNWPGITTGKISQTN
jgi:sialate O-acetylesterase